MKILIIDDDTELCNMLTEYLSSEGFQVDSVYDGESGVSQALAETYDLIMLDVMMPILNGFECLSQIRLKSQTPILMLTAKGDEVDRIVGLEMGADDYLPKPFNPRELVARLRAILRRSPPEYLKHDGPQPKKILSVGMITLKSATREVSCNDHIVDLTSTEYTLLEVLIQNAGEIVTKKDLSMQGLGRKLTSYDRSIDMHVSNIRQKFDAIISINSKSNGEIQSLIKTIRGVGYQFIDTQEHS